MQLSIPLDLPNDSTIIKNSLSSLVRSISLILNIILSFVVCIFVISFVRFVRQEKAVSFVSTGTTFPAFDESNSSLNLIRTRSYYDYERYLHNNTVKAQNRSRRYYYLDLGCFDGRDTDHFVHFHLEEISRFGTLNIIAFEPDPINFSACRAAQQRRPLLSSTVYDTAVWIENGQTRYATEKGQRSKIDQNSALHVRSIDFSTWLADNFRLDDFIYIKFTIEGSEIPILEKMVLDETLGLVDYMEIEWNDNLAPEFEPRRVVLECMFDNFGMDFLYMVNPVDARHAYNVKDSFSAVPKDRGWKLKDSLVRFHYKTRKEVPELLAERLKRRQQSVSN